MKTKVSSDEERDRTTIRMRRRLMREAKKAAIDSGQTFTEFVEESVQESLARRARSELPPFKMLTFGSGGVRPGIDINNSAQLWDILDGVEDDTPRR